MVCALCDIHLHSRINRGADTCLPAAQSPKSHTSERRRDLCEMSIVIRCMYACLYECMGVRVFRRLMSVKVRTPFSEKKAAVAPLASNG